MWQRWQRTAQPNELMAESINRYALTLPDPQYSTRSRSRNARNFSSPLSFGANKFRKCIH